MRELDSVSAYYMLGEFCSRRNNALGVKLPTGDGREIWNPPTVEQLSALRIHCDDAGFFLAQVLFRRGWQVIVLPADFPKWPDA